jgi:4-amino-4-deoxy-L-arabinose transferase-like glycosyltransferase
MKSFLLKYWPIILILILASFLRLYRIAEYAEFLGDQGRDVVIVRDFLKNGNLFFIGPQTSIGNMYLGPFYYYLFIAPGLLLTWFHPVGPAIMVAIFGVATVLLVYLLSKKWFGDYTAYLASILYAISPVIIKYSNFSWNPNIMPFFALLFVHFIIEKKYVLASLAFIICLNSHFLALLLLPVALIIFLARPVPFKQLLLPTIIFVISLTPQILFDLKHNGQNIRAFSTFFIQRETTVNLKAYKAIPEIIPLFNQVNTRLIASKNTNFGYVISTIFIMLIVSSLFQQLRTKKYDVKLNQLLAWLIVGLIGLALYKQHIYDHYFGFIYPVVVILFAHIITKLPKFFTIIIFTSLIYFAGSQNQFRWNPPSQINTTKSIDQSILAKSNGQPFNFALLAKMNYDPGYRYFFSELNSPVELLQNKITDQLFVVCEPFQMDCNPINNPEWGIAAFGWAKIDSQWEINGIKVFRLVHTETKN